jgi:hypothetical protein
LPTAPVCQSFERRTLKITITLLLIYVNTVGKIFQSAGLEVGKGRHLYYLRFEIEELKNWEWLTEYGFGARASELDYFGELLKAFC